MLRLDFFEGHFAVELGIFGDVNFAETAVSMWPKDAKAVGRIVWIKPG